MTNDSGIIKVRNTTVYEAIQTTHPNAYDTLREWLKDYLQPGDVLDIKPMQADHAWAIRRPTGEVAFVMPSMFVVEFEDVETEDFEDHTQLDLGFDPAAVIAEEEAKRRDQE